MMHNMPLLAGGGEGNQIYDPRQVTTMEDRMRPLTTKGNLNSQNMNDDDDEDEDDY